MGQPPEIGMGYSSVAVASGRAYTMGNKGGKDIVWCLDAAKGDVQWKHEYDCASKGGGYPGPKCTPAIDGQYVYTMSTEGHIFCLDGKDNGKVKWSKNAIKDLGAKMPNWEFAGSPLVAGDVVYLDVGMLVALDKATGEVKWKGQAHGASYSSPLIFDLAGKKHLAHFPADGLVVTTMDGKEVGQFPWKTSYDVHAVTPLAVNGKLFLSSGYGTGCALADFSKDKPEAAWRNKSLSLHGSNAVLRGGFLYAVTGNYGSGGALVCMDTKDGSVKWSEKGFAVGSLLLVGDKLAVLDAKGMLTLANASPEAFKKLASAQILSGQCWTMPTLAGANLYARTNTKAGELVCVEMK